MDIRKAHKVSGAMPPRTSAVEKEPQKIADVNDKGDVTVEDFNGDAVCQAYMQYLNDNGISEDDVRNVQEALLTSENVSWSFDLFNKIPVVFEVRPAWIDDYIIEIIDNLASDNNRVSNVRYNNVVAECNLAASMKKYKDQDYVINSREDLDAARKRVQVLPFIIQNALVKKLSVFDRTIAVATSDWAIKNFMKPQQEK